jgi:hypothetical protein
MRSFKKRYLTSVAAVTLMTAWVSPIPPIAQRSDSPSKSVGRASGVALLAMAQYAPSTRTVSRPEETVSPGEALGREDVALSGEDATLNRWLGLDERSLRSALGPPMEQEYRAPAKLSSFRDRSCTLHVTLNPDVETREFHALDYKVISDAHTAKRTRECAAEFSARFSQK